MQRLLVMTFLVVLAVPSPAMESLPPDHPKYQTIKVIYDNVARAFGDGRVPPRLVVSPESTDSKMVVAWSDPGTEGAIGIEANNSSLQEGYIAIEEKVYDLFTPLGDGRESALAFLLGHELTHYYMRHGWVGDFGNSFASSDMGKKMMKAATYEEIIKRETEADYFGGFYGYLAGYDTLGVASRALDLLYTAYDLPDKLPTYPSRAERKAIAGHAESNLKKMLPVFEAGNRLLLLEKYEEAARLFEHLAHTFPSRELYNNAGVAYALETIRLSKPGQAIFAYPFEFDAETRLRGSKSKPKGMPDEFTARRTLLLQQAADNFDKAIQRDKGYAVAHVNLAAVNTLLGDHDTAVILANRGMELARKGNENTTLANALVVRGISYAAGNNRERAMVDFAAARNMNSREAALNLSILQDDKFEVDTLPGKEIAAEQREAIGGVFARDTFVKDKDVTSFSLQGVNKGQPMLNIHARQRENREDTLIVIDGRLIRVVAAIKGYGGETARGVRIGGTLAEVRQKYGDPARVITARQGVYYLYNKAEIIFAANQDGKISGWMIFAIQ